MLSQGQSCVQFQILLNTSLGFKTMLSSIVSINLIYKKKVVLFPTIYK